MGKGITPEDMRKIAKEQGVKGTERMNFHECLEAITEIADTKTQ